MGRETAEEKQEQKTGARDLSKQNERLMPYGSSPPLSLSLCCGKFLLAGASQACYSDPPQGNFPASSDSHITAGSCALIGQP